MPIREDAELVRFDGEAALDAALGALKGPLYSFVEFTFDGYNTMYVADETIAMYEDRDEMEEHFSQLHDYVNLDFTEIQLFTDALLPVADEVHYIATSFDYITIVRIYKDDQGLFLAVDPDESIVELVDAVRESAGFDDLTSSPP